MAVDSIPSSISRFITGSILAFRQNLIATPSTVTFRSKVTFEVLLDSFGLDDDPVTEELDSLYHTFGAE